MITFTQLLESTSINASTREAVISDITASRIVFKGSDGKPIAFESTRDNYLLIDNIGKNLVSKLKIGDKFTFDNIHSGYLGNYMSALRRSK